MEKITAFNKVWLYIICVVTFSAGLVSCETDDSDVSRIIAGGGGDAPEQTFAMEGNWVAGGLNMDVTMSILSNEVPLGETIEGMVLELLNNSLPVKLESLSDLEVALKIEPGTEEGKVKISSPTIGLLTGNNDLALELPQTEDFTVHSENGLATLLKQLPDQKLTLLNYVTEETPKGILISESPLAGLADIAGEQNCPPTTTLKSIFLSFSKATSSFDINVLQDERKGKAELKMQCSLTIEVDGAFLLGIMLKNKTVNAAISLYMDEWTAL